MARILGGESIEGPYRVIGSFWLPKTRGIPESMVRTILMYSMYCIPYTIYPIYCIPYRLYHILHLIYHASSLLGFGAGAPLLLADVGILIARRPGLPQNRRAPRFRILGPTWILGELWEEMELGIGTIYGDTRWTYQVSIQALCAGSPTDLRLRKMPPMDMQ